MVPKPLHAADCAVADLAAVVETATDPSDCPHAHSIALGVPQYASADLRARLARDDAALSFRRTLMAEWAHVWSDGPGIVVLQGFYPDAALVDAVTEQFRAMIAEARASGPAATTSPSRAPMTASGIRWKSTACARPGIRRLLRQRADRRWSAKPGSARATR